MNIKQAISWASDELTLVCERPIFEAQLILCHHLKCTRVFLLANEEKILNDVEFFKEMIKRRKDSEPYEYISNNVSFYDINLFVEQGVLIPRPETELLIDEVSKIVKEEEITTIAEIGIGSGAISIILARKFPNLKIIATDISQDALRIAKKNIEYFGLSDKIKLIHTNLLDGVQDNIDMIVSNPPYIANDFILDKNIIKYEPKEALFGGIVGDEILKKIIDLAKIKEVKFLACEMGYDQKQSIAKYLNQININSVKFYKDLAGLDRGFIIKF
ncbi:MAG: peptide chain release factor N(5)-glutamine methyltransferase [Sulfurovaceae bacterium]|nr:peptide chain release factor N(5)-glutamine methyltransferase [Sulfurovaceae bacterium]